MRSRTSQLVGRQVSKRRMFSLKAASEGIRGEVLNALKPLEITITKVAAVVSQKNSDASNSAIVDNSTVASPDIHDGGSGRREDISAPGPASPSVVSVKLSSSFTLPPTAPLVADVQDLCVPRARHRPPQYQSPSDAVSSQTFYVKVSRFLFQEFAIASAAVDCGGGEPSGPISPGAGSATLSPCIASPTAPFPFDFGDSCVPQYRPQPYYPSWNDGAYPSFSAVYSILPHVPSGRLGPPRGSELSSPSCYSQESGLAIEDSTPNLTITGASSYFCGNEPDSFGNALGTTPTPASALTPANLIRINVAEDEAILDARRICAKAFDGPLNTQPIADPGVSPAVLELHRLMFPEPPADVTVGFQDTNPPMEMQSGSRPVPARTPETLTTKVKDLGRGAVELHKSPSDDFISVKQSS
ncbi:hypothetical protein FRB96_003318 [Tulasnella sp. 330]|nr:hypothetical protein FRB96_003318 [Tulasnella sp. 330]KAG8880816.1 hypothetical protein FRB97_000407 [Tulasnella sp. 331]KAG8889987.1 hypothetical protein FRB98_001722 [Tulasnella sp. 332]